MKSIRIANMKVLNMFKLSCWPAEVTWMRRTLLELIVIVIVIARKTRNYPLTEHEWSIPPHSAVVSA